MAILPDEDGTIFTGSGLCNEKGLLELPENALVFFYTSAEEAQTVRGVKGDSLPRGLPTVQIAERRFIRKIR